MKKKVCFLFGAGAEGKGNFDIMVGVDFMRSSFLDKNIEKTTSALKGIFGEKDPKYFGDQYGYTGHTLHTDAVFKAILKKWIFNQIQNKELYNTYKKQIRAILNKEEFKELLQIIHPNYSNEKIKKILDDIEKEDKISTAILKKFD